MGDYATPDNVYDVFPPLQQVSDLTSGHINSRFIADAEAEINAKLAKLYAVPVSDAPILTTIAIDLTLYRILSRRTFPTTMLKDSEWVDRYRESRDLLDDMAAGKTELVDSSGSLVAARTDVAIVESSTQDYLPTYHEGGSDLDQILDEDKNDDLLDERDL